MTADDARGLAERGGLLALEGLRKRCLAAVENRAVCGFYDAYVNTSQQPTKVRQAIIEFLRDHGFSVSVGNDFEIKISWEQA